MIYIVLNSLNSFCEQVRNNNCIFEVRNNFIIDEDFVMPNGCVLLFRGGCLGTTSGHSLDLNNCDIDAHLCQIFDTNIVLSYNTRVKEAYPQWFGAKGDGNNDDTNAIQKCCTYFKQVHIVKGNYKITSTICIPAGTNVYGDIGSYESNREGEVLRRDDYKGTRIYPYFNDSSSEFAFYVNLGTNSGDYCGS